MFRGIVGLPGFVLGLGSMSVLSQLVGRPCRICGRSISLADQGRGCSHCERAYHCDCLEAPSICPECGAALVTQETPAPDWRRSALRPDVPSPMRGGRYACAVLGTTMAVLGFAVPVLLFGPGLVFPWLLLASVDDLFLGFGVGLMGLMLRYYATRHWPSSPG